MNKEEKKNEIEIVGQESQTLDLARFNELESGFEGTNADTFKTPFMRVLQKLSHEVDPDDAAYVEGAKPGMFFNTATKETFDSLKGIVLKIDHVLMVWKPEREGLAGVYTKSEESNIVARREGNYKWDAEGNEIDDTISFYIVNPEDLADIYILSVSKASMKHGKSFSTRMRALKYNGKLVQQTWAGIWDIGIAQDENKHGKWYTIGNTPKFIDFVNNELIENVITPALEMLKTAETDYNNTTNESSDQHNNEDF